jgi:hypothetical protein
MNGEKGLFFGEGARKRSYLPAGYSPPTLYNFDFFVGWASGCLLAHRSHGAADSGAGWQETAVPTLQPSIISIFLWGGMAFFFATGGCGACLSEIFFKKKLKFFPAPFDRQSKGETSSNGRTFPKKISNQTDQSFARRRRTAKQLEGTAGPMCSMQDPKTARMPPKH